MNVLRWEIVPLIAPWASPQTNVLTAPIASGSIAPPSTDTAAPAFYGPSTPITVPPTTDGAGFHLLVLTSVGGYDWIVTMGNGTAAPQPGDGTLKPSDTVPCILVAGSPHSLGSAPNREVRAIRPGARFTAQIAKSAA